MTPIFLAALLVASAGPLDAAGGHEEGASGRYHFHSGPSFHAREVDASGALRARTDHQTGWATPAGEDSGVFSTPFLLYTLGTAAAAGLLAWRVEEWWRARRHHRKHRKTVARRRTERPDILQRIA